MNQLDYELVHRIRLISETKILTSFSWLRSKISFLANIAISKPFRKIFSSSHMTALSFLLIRFL
ncbi:hypothetical protein LBK6_15775 [Leptospira borgpetersenii serovar Hardjo]|nr:hypothetical protein LBK6_15775 [Leptospira borgpetersenii serovar Hardjo]EMN13720.1 hypothetical protein LEP1GSC055_3842 [Leptospira borgpetersenii str. Brem 307]AMX62951.1 hypothetical protein LBK9_15690 [Leptospira borgpetersenii serovar Hardjo]AMX66194.1 hypothetical protein LBK30_15690 [Leptospira borgpetersenii serovar Hardjo]AMX69426.1 hypothetical protein LBHA_15655 [Leptospira borgpetersenii serovar Hardjo]